MLKIILVRPGHPDREIDVRGDVATVGRGASCDVVVDEPFVSKQHLRVLHGIVVADLGSSNGTFVDGQRLAHAQLFTGVPIRLAQSDIELRIVVPLDADSDSNATLVQGEYDGANEELEIARSHAAVLESEVERLRRELAAAAESSSVDEQVSRMRGENASLRERIESLKSELEAREVDDADSVQARLARQRIESVQAANEKLQAQVDELRIEIAAREGVMKELSARAVPAQGDDSGEVDELRASCARLESLLETERAANAKHTDQVELVRRLRQELDAQKKAAPAAKAAGAGDAEALAASRKESVELRQRVAELEGRLSEQAPKKSENASDLFFKLQGENFELRKRITALEKGGAAAPAAAEGGNKRDVKTMQELMEARMRITGLESELAALRVKSAEAPKAAAPPPNKSGGAAAWNQGGVAQTPPAAKAEARPAVPAAPPATAASSAGTRRIIQIVIESDVEGLERDPSEPVEDFVVKETVRLARHVERVVTRVAGDLIQLFQLHTMLPDTTGTYRDLIAEVLQTPNASSRGALVEYMDRLGQWLVAAIGAHRKAAMLFALELKSDLTEAKLTSETPMPGIAKVPFLARNELWTRAQAYLAALSPDTIDERIDRLAREQAESILAKKS